MIKYRIQTYQPYIKKVECVKESKLMVWVDMGQGQKPFMQRKGGEYFDTYYDAKDALLERSKLKLERLNNEICRESKTMAEIERLEE